MEGLVVGVGFDEATLVGKRIAEVFVESRKKFAGTWRQGAITESHDVFRDRLQGSTITHVDRVADSVFLSADTGKSSPDGIRGGRWQAAEPTQVLGHAAAAEKNENATLCIVSTLGASAGRR